MRRNWDNTISYNCLDLLSQSEMHTRKNPASVIVFVFDMHSLGLLIMQIVFLLWVKAHADYLLKT